MARSLKTNLNATSDLVFKVCPLSLATHGYQIINEDWIYKKKVLKIN